MNKFPMKKLKISFFNKCRFKYCEVNKECSFNVETVKDYKNFYGDRFKDLYTGFNKTIADFDSGILCLNNIIFKCKKISNIDFSLATYKVMPPTIGLFSKEINEKKVNNYSSPTLKCLLKRKKNHEKFILQLSVGVGMVLSVVALKGSTKSNDKTPHLLLTIRNNGMRKGHLDVAVVEGLNSFDIGGEINLDKIAVRALEEERGINYSLLNKLSLIKMPEKYYFGLDEDYNQWNFFGTIFVDCTIEELIRQSFYFTKDKYETKEILGIPLESEILPYYLSQNELKIQNAFGDKIVIDISRTWETLWASIVFAFQDYKKSDLRLTKRFFGYYKNKKISKIRTIFRNALDTITNLSLKHSYFFNLFAFSIAFASAIIKIIDVSNKIVIINDILNYLLNIMLTLIVLIFYRQRFYQKLKFSYYNLQNNDFDDIYEIKCFRNVSLIDGNVYNLSKKIYIKKSVANNGLSEIKISRSCNVFDDKYNFKSDSNEEEYLWEIKESNIPIKIRVIIAYVTDNNCILIKKHKEAETNFLKSNNLLDTELFSGKLDIENEINVVDFAKDCLKKHFDKLPPIINNEIYLKYLLKNDGTYIMAGYCKCNENLNDPHIKYPLENILINNNLTSEFDDVTRSVIELVRSEILGYQIY